MKRTTKDKLLILTEVIYSSLAIPLLMSKEWMPLCLLGFCCFSTKFAIQSIENG